MEEQLSWVLKLKLQEMAFRRIMVHLWNKTVILALNENLNLKSPFKRSIRVLNSHGEYYVSNINKVIEDMVKDDVLKLVLPKSLKDRMMHFVKPIGLEILKWQNYHEIYLNTLCKKSYISIIKQLYWTSTGVIDYRKTAQELVRLEMLDVFKRYRLACLYCIVDYIPVLWEELPELTKGVISYDLCNRFVFIEDNLENYWVHFLNGEVDKLDSMVSGMFGGVSSFHQIVFEDSACRGIKAATEYFFEKLTKGERDFSLFSAINYIIRVVDPNSLRIRNFPGGQFSDIICYLFSKMTCEEKMKVLMQWPCNILGFLLQWPWQDLFLDVADVIWTFLPETRYDEMLHKIADNIQYPFCYFPDLIQKFFQGSPTYFINRFVNNECNKFCLFNKFFRAEDMETIKVIFTLLDAKDKARLLSGFPFYELLHDLVVRNKGQLVELCLREAMLSREEDKESLKEDFRRFFAGTEFQKRRLFELLDKMEGNKPVKRSSEETKTEIKRLCCEKQTNELP